MKKLSMILFLVFYVTACGDGSDKGGPPADNSVTFTVVLKSLDIRDGNDNSIDLDVSGISNTLTMKD